MGKGSGDTQTVQKADPWAGQQPYLTQGFREAQNIYNSAGPQFYPGATYVPFSQQTEQALGMMQNRALSGSPVEQGMQNYVLRTMQNPGGSQTNNYLQGLMGQGPNYMGGAMPVAAADSVSGTARGHYLNSNPYLDSMYQNAARQVTDQFTNTVNPAINATFGAAGRTGGGLHGKTVSEAAQGLGDSLQGMAANIYGTNYQQERDRQMQAAGLLSSDDLARRGMNQQAYQFANQLGLGAAGEANRLLGLQGSLAQGAASLAPTAAGLDWQNLQQLAGVGGAVEGKANEALQGDIARNQFYQTGPGSPEQRLAQYIAAIQGNYGGASTTTQNASSNPLSGAVGGGLLGGALGHTIGTTFGGLPTLAGLGSASPLMALMPWIGGGALLGGLLS